MTQVLDSVSSQYNDPVLCCYINSTNQLKVARISNIANWYFERVVFPGQRLMFEAPSNAQLEIHSEQSDSATLVDRIPCQELQVVL